jgi:GNAT superfamily N-acetyltransferase
MVIKRISFQQILSVWKNHLWPNRHSAIETHSAMTWPFDHNPDPIDISIFQFTATFWGAFHNQVLVGVNSGHLTNPDQYRSRGLWVDPVHRGQGIAKQLLTQTEYQAIHEGARMIWSMPRISALAAYTGVGYVTVGDSFGTETSEANIYAVKRW